jgi:3-hydroxyacyl-CoA dehydrogenase/enoyl-CoA hydratase/3-hydroxybutyryl-CoA epimerase
MKATEADLGANAIDQDQKKLLVEMVEKQRPLRPQERQGLLRLSREGQGPKSLWPGLADAAEEARSRHARRRGAEAAPSRWCRRWKPRARVEDHVITDVREADVGSILGFGFAPFTGGTLSYIDMMGTKKFVELCQQAGGQIRLALHPPKLLVDMAAKVHRLVGMSIRIRRASRV